MSDDFVFVWNREDGEPWESVESLPLPLDTASRTSSPAPWEQTTYDGSYFEDLLAEDKLFEYPPNTPQPHITPRRDNQPWESLESLPPPQDDVKGSGHEPPTVQEEEGWDEAENIPRSPTTPRATSHPTVISNAPPLYDMGYIDTSRRPIGIIGPIIPSYPPYPSPLSRRRPIGLPRRGSGSQPGRTPGPPTIISLVKLVEKLGISDTPHDRRGRRRPRSPLSPPPFKPAREAFVIEDISYEVRDERVFANGEEIIFPKPPRYLPPITKKYASPLRGKSRHDHTHGHQSRPAYLMPWDGQRRISRGININTVLWAMERSGQVQKKKKKHKSRRSEYDGSWAKNWDWDRWNNSYSGRYYHPGNSSEKGKKATVEDDGEEEPEVMDGKDRTQVKFTDHDIAYTSGPEENAAAEWKDIDDHADTHDGRGRRRRRSIDGSNVDVYESSHYHPDEARPWNVKRVRDQALKTLGKPKKDKGKAPAFSAEGDDGADGGDPDDIYDASDAEEPKRKKTDHYEAFKKTTRKHPKNFRINWYSEVVESFVLDRKPLAEGEEDPKGRDRRKPMIDVVNVKTGERTRKKIKGYDGLPKMIKVAAGVEMLNGQLPPRRREVKVVEDEDEAEAEGEEERPKPKRKKGKGKGQKKDGCVVM